TSSTRYMQEFGAIFRRQGDLWRQVGDAELRLGHFAPALDAYRRAAALPAIDQRADITRVVYAAMRAGRPAAAAMAVIEEIIETGGLVGEHHLALLRHIAGTASYDGHTWNSPVRLETAAALSTYRSSLGDSLAPAVARSMVRA